MSDILSICDQWVIERERSIDPDPSLMTGYAGLALYWLIRAKSENSKQYFLKAHECLAESIYQVKFSYSKLSFFEGPLGILHTHQLWAELCEQKLISKNVEQKIIEEYLSFAGDLPGAGHHDWISGTGAWMIYSKGGSCHEEIGDCIYKYISQSLCPHPMGIALETSPVTSDQPGRVIYGWGHGFASSIVFLSWWGRKASHKASLELARELAQTLYRIVVSQNYLPGKGDEDLSTNRQHWCHGSLGIGFSLLYAGKSFNNAIWEKAGKRLIRDTFRHQQDFSGSLCHGPEGLFMLRNRLLPFVSNLPNASLPRNPEIPVQHQMPMILSPLGLGLVHSSDMDFWWSDFILPVSLMEKL